MARSRLEGIEAAHNDMVGYLSRHDSDPELALSAIWIVLKLAAGVEVAAVVEAATGIAVVEPPAAAWPGEAAGRLAALFRRVNR